MKVKREFRCKVEELPVIGEFVLNSANRDATDFQRFSPIFTPEYLGRIEGKIKTCKEVVPSSVIARQLKATTETLKKMSDSIRLSLNVLEGYLKLAADELDIRIKDIGLAAIRRSISHGNTEGLTVNVRTMLVAVKRNQAALEAKGLRPGLLDDILTQIQEIETLNLKQNTLQSDRTLTTAEDLEAFNDLWRAIKPLFDTGKALYRGVNAVKLNDYTLTHLVKRINAEGNRKKEK
jgi:hypothetical protein